MKKLFLTLGLSLVSGILYPQWEYMAVDSLKQKWGDWNEPQWLRYFGLDAGDVNHDGLLDIVSGRYVYHQPRQHLSNRWKRYVLDDNVDGIFILDVDGDAYTDIIAQALPDIYWYEAVDLKGTRYVRQKITEVPATSHVNSQGFEKAQVIPGGKEELLIAGNGNVYLISIPERPDETVWPTQLIGANTSDEGIGVGDIDGDGDLDIACGRRPEGEGEPKILVWFENEGRFNSAWKAHFVAQTKHPIDRVKIGDLNGDGQVEIIVAEERYPGLEPDSNILWFERKVSRETWTTTTLTTQYSSNNLDVVDLDSDGDLDIISAEHKGEQLELQLWTNSGTATFTKTVLDTGKENHLGAKTFDMDQDGDLDIIGSAWDNYRWVHYWKNTSKARTTDSLITKYQDRDHYIIQTKSVTYYYDIAGGGFSRMLDTYGNDWIAFKQSTSDYPHGAAGTFRGIPNLVYQGGDNGAGHPGFDQCTSWFEDGILYSESISKKWKWRWTFHDTYTELEMLKTDPDRNYWFLYECTPGGKFKPDTYYFGTNAEATRFGTPDFYKGQALFLPLQWAYVGVRDLDLTFFMLHRTDNPKKGLVSYLGNSEKALESRDGMTVFGFGRGATTNALFEGPETFVIGLYPEAIVDTADYDQFVEFLKQHGLKNKL
ncbi:MAG: VCBS repeat-containing protein [Bacteroidota bacterium]